MSQAYGWSKSTSRAVCYEKASRGSNISLLSAVRETGLVAYHLYEKAVNNLRFIDFIEKKLAPTLKAGDVVIMDNVSFHKKENVRIAIEKVGATVRFTPPYSPQFNAIEEVFSLLKQKVRKQKPRTLTTLVESLKEGWCALTEDKMKKYIAHMRIQKISST